MLESHGHKVGQQVQYWIQNGTIIAPDRAAKDESSHLGFWGYPPGIPPGAPSAGVGSESVARVT